MYSGELRKIANIMQGFHGVWDLPSPATSNQINNFIEDTNTALQLKLPDDYIGFLKKCDGIEFDGYIIYGTNNFLENQADCEYISKKYFIFAEYDIGWFCMKKSDGSFWELDKPSGQEMQQFLCAGDMIRYILSSAANLTDS